MFGEQHGGDDAQTAHPQQAEYQEACAEAEQRDLVHRLAGFGRQRRILLRRGNIRIVCREAFVGSGGHCITHH